MAEQIERYYIIPLRNAKIKAGRTKRAPRAIKEIKYFVSRHMKAELKDVWIDTHLNQLIWARGIGKIPSKVRVKVIKFEDGVVEVDLPEAAANDTDKKEDTATETTEEKVTAANGKGADTRVSS